MIEFTDKAPQHLIGKRIPILKAPYNVRFDMKFDVNTSTLYGKNEESSFPSFNDLIQQGIVKEYTPYQSISLLDVENKQEFWIVDSNGSRSLNATKIVHWFTMQGIEVSYYAVAYCFTRWKRGYKSGYRCRHSHLFTPSGSCNPLSFHATTLHPTAKEWQKTYEI